jgi:uncharacterized phage protein (TIGR02220 family)
MEIDLKSLSKSCMFVTDFILLQMVQEQVDITEYNWDEPLDTMCRRLEEDGYIKILGFGQDQTIELRQKAVELFETNNRAKEIDEVLLYLNKKADVDYRLKTKSNREVVSGRLTEGYSVEVLKGVVDTMVNKWKGDPTMEMYLRPETIFGQKKFQGYYNMFRKAKPQEDWTIKKV